MKKLNINFKDRNFLFIILCIVLFFILSLTIVYAALSVTLNITGTAQVMDASWDIHFSNIKVNPASVPISPQITDNDKITFSADLTTPGEFYKFTVDIVNSGSLDAMIDSIVTTSVLTTDQKKYLKFEIEYIDGQQISTKQILKSNETKTISVLFSYRNDIPVSDLPTTETNFNVELQLVYYQADNTGVNITNGVSKVNVVSGDGTKTSDEVCIGDECFYVMYSDEETVTMLAKYNLYIGNECTSSSSSSCTAYGDAATGKQDSTMIGYGTTPRKGTTKFSNTDYWSSTYPAYVYDSNSILYSYVENYKAYLSTLGVTPTEARLITKEELEGLGCSSGICSGAPSWVYATSYWSGSATSSNFVWRVYRNGGFGDNGYSDSSAFGCRVIDRSLL